MCFFFLQTASIFPPFFQRVLYYFIDKIFFPQNRSSRLEVFCKRGVLSISQNSPENTCVGVLSFSEVAGYRPVTLLKWDSSTSVSLWILQKINISRKSSIVECSTRFKIRLSLWQVLVGKVNRWKKSLTLIWQRQEKIFLLYSETYLELSRTFTMELF